MEPISAASAVVHLATISWLLVKIVVDTLDAYPKIDEQVAGLGNEVQMTKQTIHDVKDFVKHWELRPEEPLRTTNPGTPILLKSALQGLVTELNQFQDMVESLQNRNMKIVQVVRKMLKEGHLARLKDNLNKHNQTIVLAFQMMSIKLQQANQEETIRILNKIMTGLETLKRHSGSRQSNIDFRKVDWGHINPQGIEMTEWLVSADTVCKNLSRSVTEKQPTSDQSQQNLGIKKIRTRVGSGESIEGKELTLVASNSPKQRAFNSFSFSDDSRLAEHTLLGSISEGKKRVKQYIKDGKFNEARQQQEFIISRSQQLESAHNISFDIVNRLSSVEELARINELDGDAAAAIQAMESLPRSGLNPAQRWRIDIRTAKLFLKKPDNEQAKEYAHKSLGAAEEIWSTTTAGTDQMIQSLELLATIYDLADDPLARTYRTDIDKYLAWGTLFEAQPALRKGADISEDAPLVYAASHGLDLIVEKILASSPDLLNERDQTGATALIAAADNKHIAVVRSLLNTTINTVDIAAIDDFRDTALHRTQRIPPLAFDEKDKSTTWYDTADSITLLLLEHGADSGAKNKWKQTPLHLAAEHGNCKVVRTLLDRDPSLLNAQDKAGSTPVHVAIEKGRIHMVRLLLNFNPDITVPDNRGRCALDLSKDSELGDLRNAEIISLLKNETKERAMTAKVQEVLTSATSSTTTSTRPSTRSSFTKIRKEIIWRIGKRD